MTAKNPLATWIASALALTFFQARVQAGPAGEPDPLAELDRALEAVAAFEYGKDAGPLELVERLAVESALDPARRAALEERLLKTLASEATRDGREFLCRQLRTVGTARSVPALEAVLGDPQLSHMARFALGRIEAPEAAAALHRTLARVPAALKVGIANTLGERRYRPAARDLAQLLEGPDRGLASAAAVALGKIGGPEASAALEAARARAQGEERGRVDGALLRCAEAHLAEGAPDEAVRIYEIFLRSGEPEHLRIAALGGLLRAGGGRGGELLAAAIRGGETRLRLQAIGLARTAGGSEVTRALADLVPALAPEVQALVVGALGERGDEEAFPAVAAAARSEHEAVRAAACETLGRLGGTGAVEILVAAAARSGREQAVARAGLLELRGEEVNGALLGLLGPGESAVRVEAVRALAGRRAPGTVAAVLELARDADRAVRAEAYSALGRLAGAPELPALLDLLSEPADPADRAQAAKAVARALERVPDSEARAQPVLAALSTAPGAARPHLLRLLAGTPVEAALAAARGALRESDPAVRDAALATLCDWPDARPAAELLELARALDDPERKARALGGYVRLAALAEDPAALYAKALELAARPDEKRLVLRGLGGARSVKALDLVEPYLREPELQAEAGEAAVRIAGWLRQEDPGRARRALDAVVAALRDGPAGRRAQEAINDMEKYEGYILSWRASGPYLVKGKESRAVFDSPFPPEDPDAEAVWRPLRRGLGSWEINLEAAFGGLDHCGAYLRAGVWSPREQDVRLEVGSDDAIKVWVNGKLLHANYAHRGLAPRQDLVAAKLREGWNELMLKVVDHDGGWATCCRIRGPDGRALEGLKVEAR